MRRKITLVVLVALAASLFFSESRSGERFGKKFSFRRGIPDLANDENMPTPIEILFYRLWYLAEGEWIADLFKKK